MKRSHISRYVAIAIIVLPLVPATGYRAFSQRNANPATNQEPSLTVLMKLPGKLLSEAKAARPSGDLKLTGYRVEELRLPQNMTVELRGQEVVVNRAWRVTVNGGPFPVRALPAVIWIDDQIVGNGVENELLSQISAITFDSSLIREGGVVSLSYGENKETRVKLSRKLQLKREGENQ